MDRKSVEVDSGERAQFLGTGGTYYVMSQLQFQKFHASCTFGNAPSIDLLVSTPNGSKTLAIQVKTAFEAIRLRGRGNQRLPHHLEWPLGHKAAKLNEPLLFFAFVDARGKPGEIQPDVYIVPSTVVYEHCKNDVDRVKWMRFHVPIEKLEPFKNNWTALRKALED